MSLYDDAFGPSARSVRLVPGRKRLAYEPFEAVDPDARRIGWGRR